MKILINLTIVSLFLLPFQGRTQGIPTEKMLVDSIEKYKAKKQDARVLSFSIQLKEKVGSEKGDKHPDFAKALNYLGETYRRLGKPDSSEFWLSKSLIILKESLGDDNAEYATSINNLGILYLTRRKMDLADSCIQVGLKIRLKILGEESPFVGTSYHNLGQVQFQMGNAQKAESYYQKALTIRRKALGENHLDVAATYNNLGTLNRLAGNYLKAEEYALRSIEIRKSLLSPNHEEVGYAYGNLGNIFLEAGDYAKSEKYYLLSISITSKALGPEHPELADLYTNGASLYYRKGNFSKSETWYLKALDIKQKEEEPDAETMSAIFTNLGNLSIDMGNPKKAEYYNLKALAIGEKQMGVHHPTVCNIYSNLGIIYANLGQLEKSNEYHKKSIEGVLKTFGEEYHELGSSHICLGTNLEAMGRIKQAEEETQKAIQIWTKAFGKVHPKLADGWTNLGYLNEAKGNPGEAERFYLKSLAMQYKTMGPTHPDVGMSHLSLGILNMKRGQLSKAEPFFLKNVANCQNQIDRFFPGLSGVEKEKLVDKLGFDFQNFAAFALKRHATNPAILGSLYNLQLANKGLLLSSSKKFKSRLESTQDSSLKAKFLEWESLTNEISGLYTSPDSADQSALKDMILEAEKLEKELSRKSGEFIGLKKNHPASWTDIQKKLKPGEAAVEIIRLRKFGLSKWITDSSDSRFPRYAIHGLTDTIWYAALIIKPTSAYPELVLMKNGNMLESRWIQVYRNTIRSRLEDKASYNQFWNKIDSKLGKSVTRVYLSPDGIYHSINFNTLINPKTGSYLLDERDIRTVTNTREILTAGIINGNKNVACLVGFPEYNAGKEIRLSNVLWERANQETDYELNLIRGEMFGELPGTKVEVENISSLLKSNGWQVDQFMGERALEENVKSVDQPRVLHIATHGFFQPDSTQGRNPLVNSGLLFSGANKTLAGEKDERIDDGILTAYEAMNLNLDKTDLVVLSACETGLGEIKNGEGVYGLQRAFKVAGAKSIIMSLWKVNDEATQELMVRFYKHWLSPPAPEGGVVLAPPSGAGGPGLRSAFLKAQKELKAKYPDPYYWGAFVMVGE